MTAHPRIVAVLQARTSSSRLPAKSLLPVGGYPLCVLSALRAGNDGVEVRLATSSDPSDDLLAQTAESHGITVVRGSLDDVLDRFVKATSDLAEDDVVVRLTADNTFPDSSLVREIVVELEQSSAEYIVTSYTDDGLPHGVSAEAFAARLLRQANAQATSEFEREHVTPWIRAHYPVHTFPRYANPDRWSHLRATIDTFDDYQRIARIFSNVSEPLSINWQDLCELLANAPGAGIGRFPAKLDDSHHPMCLATLDATNLHTKDSPRSILEAAVAHGVTHVHVASGSEEHVGKFFADGYAAQIDAVVTLPPSWIDTGISAREASAHTETTVLRLLAALKAQRTATPIRYGLAYAAAPIDTLLLPGDRAHGDEYSTIWKKLEELLGEGAIGRLGVYATNPQEATEALNNPAVRFIRLRFNPFHTHSEAFERSVATREDVVVVADLNHHDVDAAVVSYLRDHDWINSVAVDLEAPADIRELCEKFINE